MSKEEKYYFRTLASGSCYTLDYHMKEAKEQGLPEITLFEAVEEGVHGMFFCLAVNECTEEGSCGNKCSNYSPKNKKSGCCIYRNNKLYTHGKEVTFKVV